MQIILHISLISQMALYNIIASLNYSLVIISIMMYYPLLAPIAHLLFTHFVHLLSYEN